MYYNRLNCFNVETKADFTVWQCIENNMLVNYVDTHGNVVQMPKIYEAEVVASELESPI